MAEGDPSGVHVAVLGGGPGGYAAAFHAADHGMKVTLIDADPEPGGVCLHRGCIPSKALLHIAKLIQEAKEAEHWGVKFAPPTIDLAKIRTFKQGVVGKLTGGIAQLCKARGVKLIRAYGKFADSRTLVLEAVPGSKGDAPPDRISFDKCILA